MEKELNLNSTESIPKQLTDLAKKRSLRKVRDEDGNAIVDSTGNYVYEVDAKTVKEVISQFARKFADHGVDINEINFDDYLVEGIVLDKIPRGTLTVIQLKSSSSYDSALTSFYVFDKRKSSSGSNPLWEAGTRNMYSNKKGKRIDVGRIPDYQFLSQAENVWVIPEGVIKRDVSEVKRNRAQSKFGTEPFIRHKELPAKWWGKDNRKLDKSGYIIDPDEIAKKLDKFKKEKALNEAGGVVALAEQTVNEVLGKYNQMVSFILKVASSQVASGRLKVNLNTIERVNNDLNHKIDNLLYSAEQKAKGNDSSYWGFDYYLLELKKFTESTYWLDLEKLYQSLLSVEEVDSATEGRGCKYNRILQATEGYFIDSKILSALEEE